MFLCILCYQNMRYLSQLIKFQWLGPFKNLIQFQVFKYRILNIKNAYFKQLIQYKQVYFKCFFDNFNDLYEKITQPSKKVKRYYQVFLGVPTKQLILYVLLGVISSKQAFLYNII